MQGDMNLLKEFNAMKILKPGGGYTNFNIQILHVITS
jgi:hypothetical protein